MCQSKAEGGKRCAAHTRGSYQQAWDEYSRGVTMAETLKLDHPEVYMGAVGIGLRRAAAEYCLSAEGKVRVQADLHYAEARNSEILASLLRAALEDARKNLERQEDLGRAIREQ